MLLGENRCWSLLWLQWLTKNNDFLSLVLWYPFHGTVCCRYFPVFHEEQEHGLSKASARIWWRKHRRSVRDYGKTSVLILRWLYKSVSLDNLYKTSSFTFWKLWVHVTWIQNPQWNVIVLLFTNVESCYSCDTSKVIQNTGKFFLWNLEPVLMIRIQNPESRYWILESMVQNQKSTAWNPASKNVLDYLT